MKTESSPVPSPSEKQKLAATAATPEGREALAHVQARQSGMTTPTLCDAHEITYTAFRTAYLGQSGSWVLTIVAQGWYFPTPGVLNMYFQGVAGNPNAYTLMQTVSVDGFGLATYHVASYTSGAALDGVGTSITVQDATGTHTVAVQSWP